MLRLSGPYSLNRTLIRVYSKAKVHKDTDELIQKLVTRAQQYRQELRKHIVSSPKHRLTHRSLNSIDQTIATINMKRKQLDDLFDLKQKPDLVSLEILSNGTTHIRPLVFIRTPFSTYLFNCPEGSSRFISSLRIRPQTIQDFFITRGNWDSFGGLFGVLLSKDVADHITYLHGPSNLKYFLECVRPFADADAGTSVKQPFKVEERTGTHERSEDNTMTVHYLPMFTMTAQSQGNNSEKSHDFAYLMELKEPNKRIDIVKAIAKRVPKGPMIGKLKAGESVLLEDGTTVNPEEVYADDSKDLCPTALVVECDHIDKLESLVTNSNLQKYMNGEKQLNYLVHLTEEPIFNHEKYQSWMKSFGPQCLNLIANGTGDAVPLTDGIYTQQKMMNELCPELFPSIYLCNFQGTVTQTVEPPTTNVVYAKPYQKYPMRTTKAAVFGELPMITIEESELAERINEDDTIPQAITEFREEVSKLDLSGSRYPCVTFLGTGSAIPMKYRNVSGHLLQLNDNTSILIDCGEGTYGQLKNLFGPDNIDDVLTALSAILITHAHLDHIGGMKTIIERRREAFARKGLKYKSVILACNFNVRKMLIMYRTNFFNLEQFVHFVEIGLYIRSEDYSKYSCNELSKEITELFPKELFSPEAWNLKAVTAVQVLHTRMANGFVFDTNDGKRIVFSGDTMPCALLADTGQDADLLIHEATFEDGSEADAKRKKHSTSGQAIDIAQKMNAKLLILSHFSARYTRVPVISDRMINMGNVGIAFDNMSVPFNAHKLVPKVMNLCKHVFSRELNAPKRMI